MNSHATIRVLVVENDPEDQFLLREMLACTDKTAYELTLAGDYETARQAMLSNDYDICLLDYELDGRTGVDLIESPAGTRFAAPFVVLTDHNSYEIDLAVMQAGAADFLPKAELTTTLLERVIRYSLQHYANQQKFTFMARHDQVTGLFNRSVLLERLESTLKRAHRCSSRFAVIYFDLDGFKSINDSLGHGAGDRALYVAGWRLQNELGDECLLARIGGDEFVAVVENGDEDQIHGLVQAVLAVFRQPVAIEEHHIYLTASVGIALYPAAGRNADALINNADAAMYQAKQSGRDTVCWHRSDSECRMSRKLGLDNELREAIEKGELHLVYHPQFDLASGRVVGLEALARWNHGRLGAISPAEFVPLAEARGFIRSLTRWAMCAACQQYVAWRIAGVIDAQVTLAVNVSAQHARDEDFLPLVSNVLRDTLMPAACLELEFTENAIILGPDYANPLVTELKKLGVQVVIDDFGKGYSSLSYLTRLPVDSLKIDLSFLRGVTDNERDRAMARAIIALGASLDLRVVAEGVETAGQRSFLVNNGCRFGQGFYYAPGLAVADCTQLLLHKTRDSHKSGHTKAAMAVSSSRSGN